MLGSQNLLMDRKSPLIQGQRLRITTLTIVEQRQVVEGPSGEKIVFAQGLLSYLSFARINEDVLLREQSS